MSFIDELAQTLKEDYNESITENGAVGYKSAMEPLLDLNFKISSYRNIENDKVLADEFVAAYLRNKVLALRWLFYVRDVREGLGERRYFRAIMKSIAYYDTETVKKLLPLIAEYGRYDDLVMLVDSDVSGPACELIKKTLVEDIANMFDNKPVTLLAKWLPSENTSSEKTRLLARQIIRYLRVTSKEYRKTLSALRGYLNVVEKDMSAKNWNEIDYEKVPSRANLIYNGAFLRNDETRRRSYLEKVEKGEAKINSSVLYPHDIVHKYSSTFSVDKTLEALWKALPNTVNGNNNTIVVADGSGSMTSTIGKTSVSCLEVANALAIYFAERSTGDFKDKYITFSEKPQLVNLTGTTLRDNIRIALQHNEVANTNIEAVFNLILTTAVNGKMKQSEIPTNILIISDMEFDSATQIRTEGSGWGCCYIKPSEKLFKTISDKYIAAGYKLPKLIFWNICGRTNTIPVVENELGVALVSGFSTNIVKMVMTNETDPYKILLNTICAERYNAVEEVLK